MPGAKKILVFFNESGGGHRATAQALQEVLQQKGVGEVELLNPVRLVYKYVDWFPKWTKHTTETYYNDVVLARSWGTIATTLYYGVCFLNQITHRKELVDRLANLWVEHDPDLVISLLPGINHLFIWSLERHKRFVPFATINTDFQETFPFSWFPAFGHYYALAGTERSHRQALRNAPRKERVFRTSGMPVRASFYEPVVADIAAERQKHGLQPDRLTLTILYGGKGSPRMRLLAEWLNEVAQPLQAIFLCGHHRELREEIAALGLRYPHLLVPYTKEIPYYFDLADCLIGKSGPGFISEALVRQRPMLVDRSSVMPQERYNLKWVLDEGVGIPFASKSELMQALQKLFNAHTMEAIGQKCRRHQNRAIFEIPDILSSILERRENEGPAT